MEAGDDDAVITVRELKEKLSCILFTQKAPPDLRGAIAEDDARTMAEMRKTVKKYVSKLRALDQKSTYGVLSGLNISAIDSAENSNTQNTSAVFREVRGPQQQQQTQRWGAPPGKPFGTGGGGGRPQNQGQNPKPQGQPGAKKDQRCFFCGAPGHWKRECRKFLQSKRASAVTEQPQEQPETAAASAVTISSNIYEILSSDSE